MVRLRHLGTERPEDLVRQEIPRQLQAHSNELTSANGAVV